MKVLSIIITSPNYSVSGAVTAAINLSEAIAEDCEIKLLIMSDQDKIKQKGNLVINYVRARNRLGFLKEVLPKQFINIFWTSDINKHISKYSPDIVHFHNPVPPMALWESARFCDKKNIPYVISSHGFVEMFDYKNSFNTGFIKSLAIKPILMIPFLKTLRKAKKIFLLSPNEMDLMKQKATFVDDSKIKIVTNGYDKSYLSDVEDSAILKLIKKFNINRTKPVLFFIGNHTYNKGIDILLNSLKHTNKSFTLFIGGKIKSREEHENLLASCDIRNSESRVIFTDFLSHEETLIFYKISNCFIFPSRADTFPLVILEAMISGLPIISTKVGGIPHQLNDGTGVLINPNSPMELATAIDNVIDNPEDSLEMGKRAKNRVMKCFTWEAAAKEAISSYKSIIQKQT